MDKNNPTNLMLINATHPEEYRVAIVRGNRLENIYIENERGAIRCKGDIYKGRITRVEPSLQAAFVDFGSERHGFLPLKEIAPSYYKRNAATEGEDTAEATPDSIKEGQEVIIQIVKGERGNKGAALTTYITLAGCYLVLMPNNPRAGGISRRIEGDEREQLKNLLNALAVPPEMGLIVRTAGVDKSVEELQWDLEILLRLWQAITDTHQRPAPFLIHRESDILTRAIRDYLRKDTDAILVDSQKVFEDCQQHIARIRPEFTDRVQLYEDSVPIFTKYNVESQIETAFQHDVRLPSGGFIVIQSTEAMVAIDVNSAQDTKGENIEETAFNTNTEAAVEIARQLRLRDIGGLIAIDFIDMESYDNQRDVLNTFAQEVQMDKARVQYNRISKFGLLEVSRQRLGPSLSESNQVLCPRCNGQGRIRNIESLAFYILRNLRQEMTNPDLAELRVQVPIEVASYLLNEKRTTLIQFEEERGISIKIIPNSYMETPAYKIDKYTKNQLPSLRRRPSYKSAERPSQPESELQPAAEEHYEEAAITTVAAPVRPPAAATQSRHAKQQKPGLIQRLWKKLFAKTATAPAATKKPEHRGSRSGGYQHRSGGGHHQQRRHSEHRGNHRQGQDGGRRRSHHQRSKPRSHHQGQGSRHNNNKGDQQS